MTASGFLNKEAVDVQKRALQMVFSLGIAALILELTDCYRRKEQDEITGTDWAHETKTAAKAR
jgi:hypothetical protein